MSGSGGAAGATSLAKDELRAARLVYERNGIAWDVHCDGRVLSKRLRARFPELPIVVGVWDPEMDPQSIRQRLGANGLEFVVTSVRQGVDRIRTLAETVTAVTPEVVVVPQTRVTA